MPNWKVKAAIQGGICLFPASQSLNYLLQRFVSKNLHIDNAKIRRKIELTSSHLESHFKYIMSDKIKSSTKTLEQLTVVELGTGWFPIVPVLLSLAGVKKVISVDKASLIRKNLFFEMLKALKQFFETQSSCSIPFDLDSRRMQTLMNIDEELSPKDALASLNIHLLKSDARHLAEYHKKIDLIISNNVMEHIAPDILIGIMREFRKLLKSDGTMSHYIDMSDHYHGFDPKIGALNYLRYSEKAWGIYNNDLQYQNRLRKSDYKKMTTDAGFRILFEDQETMDSSALHNIEVDDFFDGYSEEDLLTTGYLIVSR